MPRRNQGMTLIEIVIVIVIAGILASIAVPSYRSYVQRANRAEGRAALLTLAAAQESFYLQCNTYAMALNPDAASQCSTGTLRMPARSERGFYEVSVTAASVTAWNAAAVAAPDSPQAQDVACRSLELDSTGTKIARTSAGLRNDGECWKK